MTLHRVLVADDNPDMRESLRALLEIEGYEVRTAEDGRQALKMQEEAPADLLITDLFMPVRDGFETVMGFRQSLPIIVISGEPGGVSADYLRAADLIGAQATLRKPFPPEALLEKIHDLLGPARH